jgi:hypothetical protein
LNNRNLSSNRLSASIRKLENRPVIITSTAITSTAAIKQLCLWNFETDPSSMGAWHDLHHSVIHGNFTSVVITKLILHRHVQGVQPTVQWRSFVRPRPSHFKKRSQYYHSVWRLSLTPASELVGPSRILLGLIGCSKTGTKMREFRSPICICFIGPSGSFLGLEIRRNERIAPPQCFAPFYFNQILLPCPSVHLVSCLQYFLIRGPGCQSCRKATGSTSTMVVREDVETNFNKNLGLIWLPLLCFVLILKDIILPLPVVTGASLIGCVKICLT